MQRSLWGAGLVVGLAVGAGAARAEQPGGNAVAVIDVGKVFEQHQLFQQQITGIKQEIEGFERDLTERQKGLQALEKQLEQFQSGSLEYKRQEETLARQVSDVQVWAELTRKGILEKEAAVYYTAYQQILKEVAAVADRYGIALVLRFDSTEIDPNDRQSVQKGVNRAVVFQRNRDITGMVVERLNWAAGQPR